MRKSLPSELELEELEEILEALKKTQAKTNKEYQELMSELQRMIVTLTGMCRDGNSWYEDENSIHFPNL